MSKQSKREYKERPKGYGTGNVHSHHCWMCHPKYKDQASYEDRPGHSEHADREWR